MLSDGSPFPERDLIIFLASGVILLSLLLANFLVPLIAPKKADAVRPEHELDAILNIYHSVIGHLASSAIPSQKAVTEGVAQQYYARINTLKADNQLDNKESTEVRRRIIDWEREYTRGLIEQGRVGTLAGLFYLDQLSRTLARIQHHNAFGWELKGAFEQMASRFGRRRKHGRKLRDEGAERDKRRVVLFEMRGLALENYLHVQTKLEEFAQEPDAPVRAIELISIEFEQRIARLRNTRGFLDKTREDYTSQLVEVETRALEFERESISEALRQGKISRATAKRMRDNVAMMELDIEEQLE
jgi:CPA1 family monovalent cation:H+ antiporter